MSVQRARSAEEYAGWVKQAMFEVQDLRACLEYDLEDMTRFPAFLDPLEKAINEVYQSMVNGTYSFGREDLMACTIARKHAAEVPFLELLNRINETHRKGLDVDVD